MARAKLKESLYERDFFAWTHEQAELLRREAASRPGADLDLANLAEEIESLGKRDRRALTAHLARIIEHLLKLQFSPAKRPRRGWENSVDRLRSSAAKILADSPSLQAQLPGLVVLSYEDGRRWAARALEDEIGPATLPRSCPFTPDQILDPDWWPARQIRQDGR